MKRAIAAIVGMCVVTVLLPTRWAALGEVASAGVQLSESSDMQSQKRDPSAVVTEWLDLVLANHLDDARLLTTKSENLSPCRDLQEMRNKKQLQVERSLGNEAVTVVVTNTVKYPESGRDRALAFWLVQRDGAWRIHRSYFDDPKNIEEQLRGFLMAGNAQWRVMRKDVAGIWLAGPGRPCGVGSMACGSRLRLADDGSCVLEAWGPGGPDDGMTVQRGTWRLDGDKIIREQNEQRLVSRITWVGHESLILQSGDHELGDAKFGTQYNREHVAR
jgi:hypothetical protein